MLLAVCACLPAYMCVSLRAYVRMCLCMHVCTQGCVWMMFPCVCACVNNMCGERPWWYQGSHSLGPLLKQYSRLWAECGNVPRLSLSVVKYY